MKCLFNCCSGYGYMSTKDCDDKCNKRDLKVPSFSNKRLLRKAFADMLESWRVWAGITESLDSPTVNTARMENPFIGSPGENFRQISILVDVHWDFSKRKQYDTGNCQVSDKDWSLDQDHTMKDRAIYSVSTEDDLLNPLVYLPVEANREMNFICQSEKLVVHDPCSFDDAVKFCEKTDSQLLTKMTKEQKSQWKKWVELTYSFYQPYRPMLWSDLIMINNTHYQSLNDENEYKTLSELNIAKYANPRVAVNSNGKLRNVSQLVLNEKTKYEDILKFYS